MTRAPPGIASVANPNLRHHDIQFQPPKYRHQSPRANPNPGGLGLWVPRSASRFYLGPDHARQR